MKLKLCVCGAGRVWVNVYGIEVAEDAPGAIELRSAGPGYRWMDVDGRIWSSAGAPVYGENIPRWVVADK